MSASTTFKPSIRDAGELTDHRLYGSFRSLNKFDAPIPKSKHEDIFKSKEFESTIIPLPPKPHSANATTNETNEETTKKTKKSSKERGSSGRHSKRSDEEGKKKHRHKNVEQNEQEEEKKDEEFMKYLGERHERRRKKHTIEEQESTNNTTEAHVSLRRINSSKERLNQRGDEEKNGEYKLHKQSSQPSPKQETKPERTRPKSDRNKFITKKNAFNESQDSDSDKEDNNNHRNENDDIEVDIKKTNSKQEMRVSPNSDFLKLIHNFNTMNFLLTPAPHGQTIMCKILCRRGLINEYHFFLEQLDNANILLLKTQRKMTTAKPSHFINIVNYNETGQRVLNEISCAKVSSNMARKKYKLNIDTNSFPSVESNILNVIFKSNSGEPRKVISTACLCSGVSASKEKVTYFLKNRQPYYDVNMRKFVLNYNGRAKQSSKNNFQIVDESFPDEIIMQLGKVETGEYNCDFTWPLCAMQAFGLALASLSR